MRKSKKIRFLESEKDKLSIFSWETDKVKTFLKKCDWALLLSYQTRGFVKKIIFDDFRAPHSSPGPTALHKILENLPFLAKTPLNFFAFGRKTKKTKQRCTTFCLKAKELRTC